MAVKTITVDMEAYELLARQKRAGESFSEVIKGHFGPKKTASGLLQALPSLTLEEATLDQIENQLKERRRHRAKAPRL
jgi:predicted CopG family antitoxin